MKRSQRLELLEKLAKREEQAAVKQLAASLRECEQLRQQSQQLADYCEEYNHRFAAGNTTVPARLLANYQTFFGNLESAQSTQLQRQALVEEKCDAARQRWREQYERLRNTSALCARQQAQELHEADKKEQREVDDRPPRQQPR